MRQVWMRSSGLVVGVVVALAGGAPAGVVAQPREWPAQVVTIAGQAEVFRKATGKWEAAGLRAELGEADGVRTPPAGRLTLKTGNGHSIRLPGVSQIFLLSEGQAGSSAPSIRLDRGAIWIAAAGMGTAAQLTVVAGPVTVGVRSGAVEVRGAQDGAIVVKVHHGLAESADRASGREWSRSVKAGEELVVPPSGPPGAPRALTRDKQDEPWIKWNADQDAAGGYVGRPSPR
jgi:ferric-dicitrate binding protein FerR (iron transport regulator)